MKITYSIWQGSVLKGHSLTADTIKEITDFIAELNASEPILKFEYLVQKIEQVA